MKKVISVFLSAAVILVFVSCSYSAGNPEHTIKSIEVAATNTTVRTNEQIKLRFTTLTETGKRKEMAPENIEYYLQDGDLAYVDVESNNLFTFLRSGQYEIRFRLTEELSVKGNIKISVYDDADIIKTAVKKPDDIDGLTKKGDVVEITPADAEKPLDATQAYDYLIANGATQITASAALDCQKYYERGDYESSLDLTYYITVKVLKDGEPTNEGFKLYYLCAESADQPERLKDVSDNTSDAKGFTGIDYSAVLGNLSGEKFTDSTLTRDFNSQYESDPASFTFTKDIKYLILPTASGRYEVKTEYLLKDHNKKFLSSSLMIVV